MSTPSARFEFPIWVGTDEFRLIDFNDIHTAIDDNAAIVRHGADATPTGVDATLGENTKCFWYNTDTEQLWYSDGAAWHLVVGYGEAGNITSNAIAASVDAGTSTLAARADHQHAGPGFGSTPVATAVSGSAGSASTVSRSDHAHALGAGTVNAAAIQDSAVTGLKIASTVAGAGITRNISTGELSVGTGTSPSTDTLAINGDVVIVNDASLTQSKLFSGHRMLRVGSSAPTATANSTVSTGDIWVNNLHALALRTATSTWSRPSNMPWGVIARTEITGSVTSDAVTGGSTVAGGTGTATSLLFGANSLNVTATLEMGRMYRIRGFVPAVYHNESGIETMVLSLLGNDLQYERSLLQFTTTAGASQSMSVERTVQNITGSWTWGIGLAFSTTGMKNAYAQVNSVLDAAYITIEDVGPALA